MHHVVRLNVASRGYAVYAGDPQSGFRPQPLGVPTDAVSASVQAAFDRLDAVLETRQVPATVCLRRPAGGPVVVAYGTRVAETDEHGRSGLSFAHAFELDDPGRVYAGVAAVVTVMAAGPARQLIADVRKVARGDRGVAVAEVIRQAVEGIEEAFARHRDLRPPTADTGRPAAIRHDCAGAPVLAWLSSAAAVRTAAPPWEVYDQIGSDGDVETRVVPANAGRMTASAVLWPTAALPGRLPAEPAPRRRGFVPWLVAAALLATTLGLAVVAASPDKKLLAALDAAKTDGTGVVRERDEARRDVEVKVERIRLLSEKAEADKQTAADLTTRLEKATETVGKSNKDIQDKLTAEQKKAADEKRAAQEAFDREKGEIVKREQKTRDEAVEQAKQARAATAATVQFFRFRAALSAAEQRWERDDTRRRFADRLQALLPVAGPGVEVKLAQRLFGPVRPVADRLAEATIRADGPVSVAFDPTHRWLAVGDAGGGRVVFDIPNRTATVVPVTDPQPVTAVAARADGAVLFAHQSGTVHLSPQGQPTTPAFAPGPVTVTTLDWMPDGKVAFVGRTAGPPPAVVFGVWNGQPKGEVKLDLPLPSDVTAAARQPSDRRLLVRGGQFTVRDAAPPDSPELQPSKCAGDIRGLGLSPKGDQLACVVGTTVEVWSLATPITRAATLPADLPADRPAVVRFTPDGSRLVAVRGDGTVLLWDTTTGRCVFPVGKPAGQVLAVALGDDGRLLTCTRTGDRVQVWDGLPN